MNGFKVALEIAIAFIVGAGILTVINWKTSQSISISPVNIEMSNSELKW